MPEQNLSKELLKELLMTAAENAGSQSEAKELLYYALCLLIDESGETPILAMMENLSDPNNTLIPGDWLKRISTE